MRYLIQFPAGTGDLILDAITSYIGNFKMHYRDDSAMIFDSQAAESKIASIPFAKNSFVVVASTPRRGIDKGVGQLGRIAASAKFPPGSLRDSKFRTMIQIDGGLSAVDRNVKAGLDRSISRRTEQQVEPRGMCQEYWVIGRTDLRELLLCARLPKQKRAAKAKGAVSYELSSMLVAASRPNVRDVFLDPFAGSGSFVLARIENAAHQIWYSDINLQEFERDFPRELYSDRRVEFLDDDALALSSVPDGQVDVIVTDPPWGEYDDTGMPYEVFVHAMAKSFSRVLNQAKGRFVVLTSRKTATLVEREFAKGGFSVNSTHEILVNGHPATVLVGARKPGWISGILLADPRYFSTSASISACGIGGGPGLGGTAPAPGPQLLPASGSGPASSASRTASPFVLAHSVSMWIGSISVAPSGVSSYSTRGGASA
jgi:16S rRNA G966 N2-methylase RsmD